jgi:hypothetical protein
MVLLEVEGLVLLPALQPTCILSEDCLPYDTIGYDVPFGVLPQHCEMVTRR